MQRPQRLRGGAGGGSRRKEKQGAGTQWARGSHPDRRNEEQQIQELQSYHQEYRQQIRDGPAGRGCG